MVFQTPVYNNVIAGFPVAQCTFDVFADSSFLDVCTDVSDVSGFGARAALSAYSAVTKKDFVKKILVLPSSGPQTT